MDDDRLHVYINPETGKEEAYFEVQGVRAEDLFSETTETTETAETPETAENGKEEERKEERKEEEEDYVPFGTVSPSLDYIFKAMAELNNEEYVERTGPYDGNAAPEEERRGHVDGSFYGETDGQDRTDTPDGPKETSQDGEDHQKSAENRSKAVDKEPEQKKTGQKEPLQEEKGERKGKEASSPGESKPGLQQDTAEQETDSQQGNKENASAEKKGILQRIKDKDFKSIGAAIGAVVMAIIWKLHDIVSGFLFGRTDIPGEYLNEFKRSVDAGKLEERKNGNTQEKGTDARGQDKNREPGRGTEGNETPKQERQKQEQLQGLNKYLHGKGYYLASDPKLEGTGILKLTKENQPGDKSCYIRESSLDSFPSEEGKRELDEIIENTASIASAERYLKKTGLHILAVGDARFIVGRDNGPSFSFGNDLIADKKMKTVVRQFNALEKKDPGHREPTTKDMKKPLTAFNIKEVAEEIKAEKAAGIAAVRQSINNMLVPETGLAMSADMGSDAVYVCGLGQQGVEEGRTWILSQSALAKGDATELAKIIFEHDNPGLEDAVKDKDGTMPGIVSREIDAAVKALYAVSAMRNTTPGSPGASADILTNDGMGRIEIIIPDANGTDTPSPLFRYNGSEMATADPNVFKDMVGGDKDNISLISQYRKECADQASSLIGQVVVQSMYGNVLGAETQQETGYGLDAPDRGHEQSRADGEYGLDTDSSIEHPGQECIEDAPAQGRVTALDIGDDFLDR